jgi:DNA primase
VKSRLHPSRFTIKSVPLRFNKIKDPMAPVLRKAIDLAAALRQIEKMMEARKIASLESMD